MKRNKEEIKGILPNPDIHTYQEKMYESPYGILIEFMEAINEKYSGKISARVAESYKIKKSSRGEERENIVFAFYLEAPIGKGYLYRLLEAEQIETGLYPIRVMVFEKHTSPLGVFNSYEDFYTALFNFFKSSFVSTLIINLIGQVELYNESRKE